MLPSTKIIGKNLTSNNFKSKEQNFITLHVLQYFKKSYFITLQYIKDKNSKKTSYLMMMILMINDDEKLYIF